MCVPAALACWQGERPAVHLSCVHRLWTRVACIAEACLDTLCGACITNCACVMCHYGVQVMLTCMHPADWQSSGCVCHVEI